MTTFLFLGLMCMLFRAQPARTNASPQTWHTSIVELAPDVAHQNVLQYKQALEPGDPIWMVVNYLHAEKPTEVASSPSELRLPAGGESAAKLISVGCRRLLVERTVALGGDGELDAMARGMPDTRTQSDENENKEPLSPVLPRMITLPCSALSRSPHRDPIPNGMVSFTIGPFSQ